MLVPRYETAKLSNLMKPGNFMNWFERVAFIMQLASARNCVFFLPRLSSCFGSVRDLHSCKLVHGDLKPDNVLWSFRKTELGPHLVVKLADFGFSRLAGLGLHTLAGTRGYRSPEQIPVQEHGL